MPIARSVALLCGLFATASAFAQQQESAFEYSPVARLMHDGSFRAEVWRRELATDRSDLAWSSNEPSLTAAVAASEACRSLQQNFDATFACPAAGSAAPQGQSRERSPEKSAVRAGAAAAAGKGPPAPAARKAPMAQAPRPPASNPGAAAGGKATGLGNAWAKDFLHKNGARGASE
jgi:hypothetical protein